MSVLVLFPIASVRTAAAQSLVGSPASMERQDAAAYRNHLTFIKTAKQLYYFVKRGWLVRVRPNPDLALHDVWYPYARPQLALFLRRLAAQYHAACGRKLIVTSLTRPEDHQPRFASKNSVHPAGIAVDLHYSHDRQCRKWLEGVLLNLEGAHLIEATRERYPPHYHVAVFPRRYASYVRARQTEKPDRIEVVASRDTYEVRSGDSLWTIARQVGTTVDALKAANGLDDSRIYAGETLDLPRSPAR